jgi:hypothetical protein
VRALRGGLERIERLVSVRWTSESLDSNLDREEKRARYQVPSRS